MKLFPTDPAYPRGAKRAFARLRYARVMREHGEEALVTRAALGRMLFHGGNGHPRTIIPMRNAIESVAWHRESGVFPGFMNRTYRKHLPAS